MNIALTGFMGCGKSTVGTLLNELHPEFDFIDLDKFIEESDGRKIAEIFKEDGEEGFRMLETDALETLLVVNEGLGRDCIISLGGGTVTTAESRELLKEYSETVYLRASVDTLVQNLEGEDGSRPMLQSDKGLRGRIEELMAERSAIYESVADSIVDIDSKSWDEIADEISAIIQHFGTSPE